MRVGFFVASAFAVFVALSITGVIVTGYFGLFGGADLATIIAFTVAFNVIAFFISPNIQDLILKRVYKAEIYSAGEFRKIAPEISDIIEKISREQWFEPPKVVYIPDKTPTAFTYGATRSGARIAITEGLIECLEPEERKAVVAHELGHIANYDFAIIAGITTFLEILYLIYIWGAKASKIPKNSQESRTMSYWERRGGNPFAWILAGIALTFFIIGKFAIRYASRLREYRADEFAAKHSSPLALASALMKISYGIVEIPDDRESRRLLRSTETLGIMGEKTAKEGAVFAEFFKNDPEKVGRVVAWDLYSPWAALSEITSTHPLTGKRILRLLEMGGKHISVQRPDLGRIYAGFVADIISISTYIIFPAAAVVAVQRLMGVEEYTIPALLMGLGSALVFQSIYSYPGGETKQTTLVELLGDPYVSPIRGKRVALTCKVVGKKDPQLWICEDLLIADGTGIVFANYESKLPGLGNTIFALERAEQLIDKNVRVEGWFFRDLRPRLDLSSITFGRTDRSYPYKMKVFLAAILFILAAVLVAKTQGVIQI